MLSLEMRIWCIKIGNVFALHAYLDNLYLVSDPQAEKFGNPKCCSCKDPGETPNRMPAKDLMEWSEIILKFSPYCEIKENVNKPIVKNFRSMPLDQVESWGCIFQNKELMWWLRVQIADGLEIHVYVGTENYKTGNTLFYWFLWWFREFDIKFF
jgi:hypothetical protein